MKETPHYGQIVTTKRTILAFIRDISMPVTLNTVRLLAYGVKTEKDQLRLYSTCARLYYLSRLVYKSKGFACKPDMETYRAKLFDWRAESIEEVYEILMLMQKDEYDSKASMENAAVVYKNLKILELLWCRGISCLFEQIYILELAYEIEYVLTYAGEITEPEFESEYSMFPCNYKGFDCSKGIAKYYEEAMEGLF